MGINEIRKDIDAIDDSIVNLLARREALAREIGRFKKEKRTPVRVAEREEEIIARLRKKAEENGVDQELVGSLFRMIMKNSKRLQQK